MRQIRCKSDANILIFEANWQPNMLCGINCKNVMEDNSHLPLSWSPTCNCTLQGCPRHRIDESRTGLHCIGLIKAAELQSASFVNWVRTLGSTTKPTAMKHGHFAVPFLIGPPSFDGLSSALGRLQRAHLQHSRPSDSIGGAGHGAFLFIALFYVVFSSLCFFLILLYVVYVVLFMVIALASARILRGLLAKCYLRNHH